MLPFREGEVLARKYRVKSLIGEGGIGFVISATRVDDDECVALKFLRPEFATHPEAVHRFAVEARYSARIRSEHVARVLDVGNLPDGSPFIAMELLEGTDLHELVSREGPLEVDRAVGYVLQACEALAAAHACHVVHRDIKPDNLFLARRAGGPDIVKVLDFGISKVELDAALAAGAPRFRHTALAVGSPSYMSPEQMRAAADVDGRADIWSLGCVLYELLTRRHAFDAPSLVQVCAAVLENAPAPLSSFRPEIAQELDAVVARCLEKDPARRYQDVGELAVALRPFAPEPARASVERTLEIVRNTRAYGADEAPPSSKVVRSETSLSRPSHAPPEAAALPRGETLCLAGVAPPASAPPPVELFSPEEEDEGPPTLAELGWTTGEGSRAIEPEPESMRAPFSSLEHFAFDAETPMPPLSELESMSLPAALADDARAALAAQSRAPASEGDAPGPVPVASEAGPGAPLVSPALDVTSAVDGIGDPEPARAAEGVVPTGVPDLVLSPPAAEPGASPAVIGAAPAAEASIPSIVGAGEPSTPEEPPRPIDRDVPPAPTETTAAPIVHDVASVPPPTPTDPLVAVMPTIIIQEQRPVSRAVEHVERPLASARARERRALRRGPPAALIGAALALAALAGAALSIFWSGRHELVAPQETSSPVDPTTRIDTLSPGVLPAFDELPRAEREKKAKRGGHGRRAATAHAPVFQAPSASGPVPANIPKIEAIAEKVRLTGDDESPGDTPAKETAPSSAEPPSAAQDEAAPPDPAEAPPRAGAY